MVLTSARIAALIGSGSVGHAAGVLWPQWYPGQFCFQRGGKGCITNIEATVVEEQGEPFGALARLTSNDRHEF